MKLYLKSFLYAVTLLVAFQALPLLAQTSNTELTSEIETLYSFDTHQCSILRNDGKWFDGKKAPSKEAAIMSASATCRISDGKTCFEEAKNPGRVACTVTQTRHMRFSQVICYVQKPESSRYAGELHSGTGSTAQEAIEKALIECKRVDGVLCYDKDGNPFNLSCTLEHQFTNI